MNILIIEDELPAAKQLRKLLAQAEPETRVLAVIDSVESAVVWLEQNPALAKLIFMDIQLADGVSFDIFTQIQVNTPVIFTTAYDQYTLKAFKVNSIDYLLKPIELQELQGALQKYRNFYANEPVVDYSRLSSILQTYAQPNYKERFLIKSGQELKFIYTSDIKYFFSEEGLLFAQLNGKKKFNIDFTLDQLEPLLDPRFFFRVNRKMFLRIEAIIKIHTYFNGRLKLDLQPAPSFEVIVSRDRVAAFKDWLNQ